MNPQPDSPPDEAEKESRSLRDTTRALVNAVMFDVWPSMAVVVDFGLVTPRHYQALYHPLRHGEITPEQVDAALGNGRMLTELVSGAPHNPHKDIVFQTPWDEMRLEAQELPVSESQAAARQELLFDAFLLATGAGFYGFRREFMDHPESVSEWPDPADRERKLRAAWHEMADYPKFEKSHEADSDETLRQFVAMLRDEAALGEDSQFYERSKAFGKAAREQPAGQTTLSEIAEARPADRQPSAGLTLADTGIEP